MCNISGKETEKANRRRKHSSYNETYMQSKEIPEDISRRKPMTWEISLGPSCQFT